MAASYTPAPQLSLLLQCWLPMPVCEHVSKRVTGARNEGAEGRTFIRFVPL